MHPSFLSDRGPNNPAIYIGQNPLLCFCRLFLVGVKEGRSLRPGTALAPSLLKGDIGPLADQVSWRLHNRDYRAAATLLYSMLMWNADAMDYDPSLLPRPEKLAKHQGFFKVGRQMIQPRIHSHTQLFSI